RGQGPGRPDRGDPATRARAWQTRSAHRRRPTPTGRCRRGRRAWRAGERGSYDPPARHAALDEADGKLPAGLSLRPDATAGDAVSKLVPLRGILRRDEKAVAHVHVHEGILR